jgi:hypothetical protein
MQISIDLKNGERIKYRKKTTHTLTMSDPNATTSALHHHYTTLSPPTTTTSMQILC